MSIHVPRQMCPIEDRCTKKTSEHHLNFFSHAKIHDIRLLCTYSSCQCREQNMTEHQHRYRHKRSQNLPVIVCYFALYKRTDFLSNQIEMSKALNTYIDAGKWRKPASISPDIINWIRALEPIHRCAKDTFQSILIHNNLMSRGQMKLLREPRFAVNCIVQRRIVSRILRRLNNPTLEQDSRERIEAIVAIEFDKNVRANQLWQRPEENRFNNREQQ